VGPVAMLLTIDLAGVDWRIPKWVVPAVAVLGMAVFVALNPLECSKYLPNKINRHAALQMNALVASLPGGVVVPYFAFLPARNGHPNPHWHRMAVLDAYYRGDSMNEARIFQETHARWALIQSADPGPFETYVRSHLKLSKRLPFDARASTITGALAAVDELWVVK